MKTLFSIAFGFVALITSAQTLDRKIIITDQEYYAVSIDNLFQIGTLHKGSIYDTLMTSSAYALPAGRSFDGNANPLCWDIHANFIYAISFLDHPLNDRYEAIKKIPLDSLKNWGKIRHPGEVVLESVDNNMFAPNDPYKSTTLKFNSLDTYFYDAIFYEGVYYMTVTCEDEWVIWEYKDSIWYNSGIQKLGKSSHFTMFADQEGIKLVLNDLRIFSYKDKTTNLIRQGKAGSDISQIILIEDRDQKKIYSLDKVHLNKGIALNKLIKEFAIILYE